MNCLEVRNLYRKYHPKENWALRGVDLQMKPGEVLGLLGPNGAGKTTLIRLLLGMLQPHQGKVRVFGQDPCREPVSVRRRMGYVAEDQILPGTLKVVEVLHIFRELYPTWDRDYEAELLDRFQLPLGKLVSGLSKGLARRLALLVALAHRPEILVLDEPAGGLDPAARREFLEIALTLLHEASTTVLFSSHLLDDVERLAGRIAFLRRGSLVLDRPLTEIQEGFSLLTVPSDSDRPPASLKTLPEPLSLRRRGGDWLAILPIAVETWQENFAEAESFQQAAVSPVALEDLFIEFVEGGKG